MSTLIDRGGQLGFGAPGVGGFAITKSDSVNFTSPARAIYVGGAGDVAVVFADDTTVLFSAVPVGTTLWVMCKRVNATSTTASLMVGIL